MKNAPVLAVLLAVPVLAQDALVADEVVAGGPDDFLEVRHLVLEGSQEEIGRALARVAREDLGDAFGCTVVYYPSETTADGLPILSRNLDFTSGTARGRRPAPGTNAALSRPFVLETYPDEGYASLVLCGMDLLGSAFDGVNEKGLTVALLSDRELLERYTMVPTGELAVGLSEIQVPRYLLETCANVDEAMDALLELKQYYAFVPCHYVVGDADGRAFVFEGSPDRNRSFLVERPGEPLVSTNFLLSLNPDPLEVRDGGLKSSFGRYRAVCDVLAEAEEGFDVDTIIRANRRAAFDGPGPPQEVPYAPNRTLWHALYFPTEGSLLVDFYLGEEPDPARPGWPRIRRSGYVELSLDPDRTSTR